MGKTIPDDEYSTILLGSIPSTFEATISAMSTTAALTNTTLTPDMVIRLITDKFDRCTLKNGKSAEGQDEALTANATKGKKSKKDIECFNCKKCGHMRSDCWAKGSGKEGQGPKKKGQQEGTASADQQGQQQPDLEAWAAIEEMPEEECDQSSFAYKTRTESELYDLGASCHMSPF